MESQKGEERGKRVRFITWPITLQFIKLIPPALKNHG